LQARGGGGGSVNIQTVVESIRARLAPACEKTAIVGSLRRGKPNPHDVELLLQPVRDEDMFCEKLDTYTNLDRAIGRLVADGILTPDCGVKRDGAKYKRFLCPALDMMPFELFIAHTGNWGNSMAIRTGPADFSRTLVTAVRHGGCMPNHLVQAQGYLWAFKSEHAGITYRKLTSSGAPGYYLSEATRIDCETEDAYFAALRLPVIVPAERGERIDELKGIAASGGVR
jgi:hypothetical protein